MQTGPRRIGIVAGGGSIPREIADSVAARRVPVFVLALAGEADADFGPHPVEHVGWGQVGRMIARLQAHGVTDVVIVGRVKRPDLARLRPDLGLFLALPMIWRIVRAGGDDAVLRAVISFFESKGFRVAGPADVAPELIVGPGQLGTERADGECDRSDIALGLEIVEKLGPMDIGQGVVVAGGRIEAIEGVEGTDRMLARVADLRRRSGPGQARGAHGVLIKRPKPGQELRIDLPAIGPETVTRVVEAGLHGIAVLAGRTIAAERRELVRRADAARIFVEGISAASADRNTPDSGRVAAPVIAHVAGPRPRDGERQGLVLGARVVSALAPYGAGLAAVAVRRHVLAVEAGEGTLAVLDRVAGLRQWGARGRRGAAVVRAGVELSPRLVDAAAHAGLAGLALDETDGHAVAVTADVAGAAARHGLFVVRIEPGS